MPSVKKATQQLRGIIDALTASSEDAGFINNLNEIYDLAGRAAAEPAVILRLIAALKALEGDLAGLGYHYTLLTKISAIKDQLAAAGRNSNPDTSKIKGVGE